MRRSHGSVDDPVLAYATIHSWHPTQLVLCVDDHAINTLASNIGSWWLGLRLHPPCLMDHARTKPPVALFNCRTQAEAEAWAQWVTRLCAACSHEFIDHDNNIFENTEDCQHCSCRSFVEPR